ncbi:hypothetical protein VDA_002646 [Photobacterium damselae subsp. damselae CIP 102761]|uniref:Uncharacterized protein n=6 Tax=Photobacterium damselae TaxID=38293 RepID=D0YZD3_PHODD|nr:hypothetical protein VDA_002646 [Photobacterium damselae subsp. damselae CIP 102761]
MKFGQKEKIDYLREKQQREAALKAEQEKERANSEQDPK